MAKFCGNCGTQLNDTAVFCGGCGKLVPGGVPAAAPVAQPAAAAAPVAVREQPAAPAFTSVPGHVAGPATPAKKSNTLLKVTVVCVALLFVGTALAVSGMWYAAQKIKEKAGLVGQEAGRSLGLAGGGLGTRVAGHSATEFTGDPCRFLSTQEVSQEVGVEVIRADGNNASCTYIAKGDPADMTAKRTSAIVSGVVGAGMDETQKKMLQGLTSGLAHQAEVDDKDMSAAAAKGEAPILGVVFEVGHAGATMKMSRAAFGRMNSDAGAPAGTLSGDLYGIGDEAYLAGGVEMLVRKGDTIARFTFNGCPCTAEKIKPLAKLAASRM